MKQDEGDIGAVVERAAIVGVTAMEKCAVEFVVAHQCLPGVKAVAQFNGCAVPKEGKSESRVTEKTDGCLPYFVVTVAVKGGISPVVREKPPFPKP